jgi:uncharacterized membrane protein
MSGGGDYLAAAYLVFLALVLIYVVIMAIRLSNLERDLAEIDDLAARRAAAEPKDDEVPTA